MSDLSGGSSKGAQTNPDAGGGITPQQQALAQYGYGEDLLGQANLFGTSGTGMSTMATQGAEGAKNTEAMQEASMSDTDESAFQQMTNLANAQNQQSGSGLASGLGELAGSIGGLFG